MEIKLNEDGKIVIPEMGYLEISHGTLRSQDLLPCFLEAIRETPEYVQLMMVSNYIPNHIWEDAEAEWWDSEACSDLINEELMNVLNGMAPDGYYFGTSEGDGSCFGWWEIPELDF